MARSLDSTTYAGDRSLYDAHLASAARLVALLDVSHDDADVRNWVAAEERRHGWTYLSGEEGEAVASAFVTLKAQLLGDAA